MLSFQNPTWSSKKGPGLPSYIALDDLKKKRPYSHPGGGGSSLLITEALHPPKFLAVP